MQSLRTVLSQKIGMVFGPEAVALSHWTPSGKGYCHVQLDLLAGQAIIEFDDGASLDCSLDPEVEMEIHLLLTSVFYLDPELRLRTIRNWTTQGWIAA